MYTSTANSAMLLPPVCVQQWWGNIISENSERWKNSHTKQVNYRGRPTC